MPLRGVCEGVVLNNTMELTVCRHTRNRGDSVIVSRCVMLYTAGSSSTITAANSCDFIG